MRGRFITGEKSPLRASTALEPAFIQSAGVFRFIRECGRITTPGEDISCSRESDASMTAERHGSVFRSAFRTGKGTATMANIEESAGTSGTIPQKSPADALPLNGSVRSTSDGEPERLLPHRDAAKGTTAPALARSRLSCTRSLKRE